MGVGGFCDLILCPPPYTTPSLSAAHFGAVGTGVPDTFYCSSPHLCCSVLPISALFAAVSAGGTGTPYRQTGRCPGVAMLLDGALLTAVVRTFLTPCILSGYHSLSCRERCHYPPLMLLIGVGAAIAPTWAARRRGSFIALVWHTDFATTCSRDTVIICRPPSLLHASLFPPPCHPHSLRRPPYRQQRHVCQRRCRLHGQAAVLHAPQPGGSRPRKRTLDITLDPTLEIPRLETRRASGRGLRRLKRGRGAGEQPRHTTRPGRLAGSRGGGGKTSTGLVSTPTTLACPGRAPPAGLYALDRAALPPLSELL